MKRVVFAALLATLSPPLYAQSFCYQADNLGCATINSTTGNCAGLGTSCTRTMTVYGCPGIPNGSVPDILADLRIVNRSAASPNYRGTILLLTGGNGSLYWGDSFGSPAQKVLTDLRNAGFRTVEIRWQKTVYPGGWLETDPGRTDGQVGLACRPATLFRYAHNNLYFSNDGVTPPPNAQAAFCGTGNSGGASALGYALSHYGQSALFDDAVMTSGPVFSRVDWGCVPTHPDPNPLNLNDLYEFPAQGKETIDRGYGVIPPAVGSCALEQSSPNYLPSNQVGLAGDQFCFPNTAVAVLVGRDDTVANCALGPSPPQGPNCTNAPNQAKLYHQELAAHCQSPLSLATVVSAPPFNSPVIGHSLPDTPEGARAVRDLLLAQCVIQPTHACTPCP